MTYWGRGTWIQGIFDISVRSLDLRRLWRAIGQWTQIALGWLALPPGTKLDWNKKDCNQVVNYYSNFAAAALAASLQSCPTLCNSVDCSPPGSSVPGILQARTLEWVAISFSNAWKWKVKVKSLSCVWSSVTPWTAAHQAPPSMGFSRQEYWSGVPLPSLTAILVRGN